MDTQKQLQDIGKLVQEKNFDELKTQLKDAFNEEMTPEEVGGVLMAPTLAFINASNAVNQEYKEFLESTLATLKEIKTTEKKVDEQVKIEGVRNSLKE